MKTQDGEAQARKRVDAQRRQAAGAGGSCPKCGAHVPAKAGFRLSALKCPSCGTLVGKR